MKLFSYHLESADNQFDPIPTPLSQEKVTGSSGRNSDSVGSSNISCSLMYNGNSVLIRNFLVKANNGTVSMHQLVSCQMPTFSTLGAQFLTVFISHNKSESKGNNNFNDAITYYDSNEGAIQRALSEQGRNAYNALLIFKSSISSELIPANAQNWDNVEDNKAAFIVFQNIKTIMDNNTLTAVDKETQVGSLWAKYELLLERQISQGKLTKSAILIAGKNSIVTAAMPFVNTRGNALFNGSLVYGNANAKSSFMPYTSIFSGFARKVDKADLSASQLEMIKNTYEFGLRDVRPASKKASASASSEVDFEVDLEGSSVVETVKEEQMQSFSSLYEVSDSIGRSQLIQGIISDEKTMNSKKPLKLSTIISSIPVGEKLSVQQAVVIPRSLNLRDEHNKGGSSKSYVNENGQRYNSLAITFELSKFEVARMGAATGITSNAVTGLDLDMGLDSLDLLLADQELQPVLDSVEKVTEEESVTPVLAVAGKEDLDDF